MLLGYLRGCTILKVNFMVNHLFCCPGSNESFVTFTARWINAACANINMCTSKFLRNKGKASWRQVPLFIICSLMASVTVKYMAVLLIEGKPALYMMWRWI